MHVDVCLSPRALTEEAVKDKIVVVVDVLRACSTIVTALTHGAREVLPAADMGEAGRMAAHLDAETGLLGGERDGQRIDGYGAGNSPLEYEAALVARKTVVLRTSNGTPVFGLVRTADEVVAGCFLNIGRVVDFLEEVGSRPHLNGDEPQVIILCAGQGGRTSMEDVLCAGMILHRLLKSTEPGLSDSAQIALTQYKSSKQRLARSLFNCEHTQRLVALGFGDDVAYCARVDALPVLPRYRDNRLVLDGDDRERSKELVVAMTPSEEMAVQTA